MKGDARKLLQYMEGADKRFVIPVYQRNYDWRTENCRQLYNDLVKVIRGSRKSHFFGSIVSVYNPEGHNMEFLIIDGQQRLTTVSLLFLAMYNLLDQGVLQAENPRLQQRIFEDYLVDKWQPEETRIKLKPVKNDQKAFEELFKEKADHIRGSNLTANYNYFYERIQKQEITVDELFEALYRLEIIDIVLDGEDNPQLIFESLNSTGMDLSEGDKIRNYILMGLTSRLQEKYYDEYWNPIELYTEYDVSSFVRDYLSVKRQSIPSQKRIYVSFKEYIELTNQTAEVILRDMKEYARRYRTLLHGGTKHTALDACINRLNRLETTVTRPFFLEVLRLYDEKMIDLDQVTEIFLTTENFLFRRSICDLPTNVLNKIFVALHKEILRFDGTEQNYVEKFKYVLLSKKERSRFPTDGEFSQNFAERQIYLMNSKNKIYILERLENFGTKEDKDVYRHWDDGSYSIEHIMPQHLTPRWQEELGEDYEAVYETWIHRIANLTLTAYNSEYSNLPFEEKKTLDKKGFNDSGIRLNAWIAKKEHWRLEELEERSRHLTKRALEIWPAASTKYRPAVKEEDSCTLADDEDLTGRQIERFSYRNSEQPVSSWSEMFQRMIQILYAEDKTLISGLAASDDEGLASHFAYEPQNLKKYHEIGDGIYVWTNTNTSGKLSILSRLFKLYDLDPSDLTFYLRDADEDEDEDENAQVGKYELRKRYWTYALPIIKAANVENGPFSNVSPGKDNAIRGYFGVSGCSLTCIANYARARVELVFARDSAEANKKMFDAVAAHREEVEQKLETELIWFRGDDITSSKIYLRLLNVSVENETDWKQMAAFHAEWTRKFYDVLVPYVTGESGGSAGAIKKCEEELG